jgi:hypothetical protein
MELMSPTGTCAEADDVGFACQFAGAGGSAPFTLMWTRAGTSQVNVKGIGSTVCDLVTNQCLPVTNNTVTIGMMPVRVS